MNESAVTLKLENQNSFTNGLHNYIAAHFPEGSILISQLIVKVLIVLVVFFILDLFQRKALLRIVYKLAPRTKSIWMNTFMEKDVFTSFFHLLPLGICYLLVPLIFYHHPQSFHILDLIFSVFLIIFLTKSLISIIDAYTDVSNKDKSYRTIALKTFSELLKIFIFLFSTIIVISTLFDITTSKIFTFLGAIMAVILLVFRDPILGFVAGVNVAGSKLIKVGDAISIPKYNMDGNVMDINLVTTKIQNADKTISTIPTYDLISTEVKNHEFMRSSHTRRIKRSLFFNYKSVKFVDESLFADLMEIKVLHNFLKQKKEESKFHENSEFKPQEMQSDIFKLTNIGVFRHYAQLLLEINPDISKKDTVMVRQMEPTVHGLPVEIYCFSNTSDFKKYEDIQANIFEYLIAMAPQFDLEIAFTSPS